VKIKVKLTLTFIAFAAMAILIIGFMSYFRGKESLKTESFNRLTAVREMKSSQIEDYFEEIRNQIITFSEDHTIIEATMAFKSGFDTIQYELDYNGDEYTEVDHHLKKYYTTEFLPRLNENISENENYSVHMPIDTNSRILQDLYISRNLNQLGQKHHLTYSLDGSSYSQSHRIYHPLIRSYLEKFGYYDIFIVDDETGHIIYSVFKEADYATSLLDGPYNKSNIARAFIEARESDDKDFVKLVDFEPYSPSYNAPASFIASPIFTLDGKEKLGVLIYQMPINRINHIMTNDENWEEVGLGKSGETYIVAEDLTLRNQSRFFIEDRDNYLKMVKDIGLAEETIEQIQNFESTIGLQIVDTKGTRAALKGETNTRIFNDYRGVPVLSSYKPLMIEDMNWVIMSEIDRDEAFAHVYDLRLNIVIVFVALLMLIVGASLFISNKITKPVKELTAKSEELASGNLDVYIDDHGRKDEIGIMSRSFNHMQHSIKDLVVELQDINHNLEEKVEERTQEIQQQKHILQEKNQEIVDSINYALRLQTAILPTVRRVHFALPNSFVMFRPKDIVSGDFYWMDDRFNKVLIAAIDCTGHGVPGAMVSVVGSNGLNRCIKEYGLSKPSDILDKLSEIVVETFEAGDDKVKDGMDGALCAIDLENKSLEYSGAHNPLWIMRKGAEEMEEIKADKQPIGSYEFAKPFTNHEVKLAEGDVIYFFSDGYVDQFGGPRGKKFKYKTLKKLLAEIHEKSMEEQLEILETQFDDWKGNLEQLDDVCIIGIKF
jgi:serine phosphatase RsbU (regulator of sigma subunit)